MQSYSKPLQPIANRIFPYVIQPTVGTKQLSSLNLNLNTKQVKLIIFPFHQ